MTTHEFANQLLSHKNAGIRLCQVDQFGDSVVNDIDNCFFFSLDDETLYIEGKVEMYGLNDTIPEGRSRNLSEKQGIYARQIGCANYNPQFRQKLLNS